MSKKQPSVRPARSRWELYIIRTESGTLYTGISTDVERRLREHRSGKRGARFFATSPPGRIVYRESHPDRSSASKRESAIKRMTRAEKLALIKKKVAQRAPADGRSTRKSAKKARQTTREKSTAAVRKRPAATEESGKARPAVQGAPARKKRRSV